MAAISNHTEFAPNSNFLLILESWINFISILFILMKYSIQFETLAISLSFISQRAVKAWIIENCFIYAMVNLMIVISKICLYEYALRIFFLEFHPFVTEISFWCEKSAQGIILLLHILDWVGHSCIMP